MIGILQIAGAAAVVVVAILGFIFAPPAVRPWLAASAAAMSVHFYGDVLAKFICFGKDSSMSLSSLLNSFEQAVKLKQWLQFVGMFLALIAFGIIGLGRHTQFWIVLGCAFGVVAIGVAFAGFVYNKIYPS